MNLLGFHKDSTLKQSRVRVESLGFQKFFKWNESQKYLPFVICGEQNTVGYEYEEYNKIQNNAVQVRRSPKVTICIRWILNLPAHSFDWNH